MGLKAAVRGWIMLQRARVAQVRHRDLGEVSAYCFYARRLRYRDLAFDIGANNGIHSQLMLARGARVVAVEPQRELVRKIVARCPRGVVIVPMAVGDTPGQATLHTASAEDTVASLDPRWPHITPDGSERVDVTTLDALIDQYGEPALIKIDTEGFDHRVLQGLSRPVRQILFEVSADRPDDASQALARLQELGRYEYRCEQMGSWMFGPVEAPESIVRHLGACGAGIWGNVYARRVV
jgi:FkbM family methyltransferase